MTEFLVRHFVKDHEETEKVSVRTAYGVLASMVGIFCNVFLFVVKWLIGFFLQSISVMADAFNNLSDAGGSVIGLVGVKMAEKPADKDHPFGHGRIEYIAALVVSFLVLEVGFTFFKDAVGKIREPEAMRFQLMLATATDAIGDVITTAATIASVLFWRITGWNIDGFVGLGVSLVIMWAGIGIARDTLEPLIGKPVSREEYERITRFVEGYPGIVGSHDLIVHNYGPGRSMASIHAEVPNDVDIEESHEIIDRIEREAIKNLGIFLVIHMDPIETKDAQVLAIRKQVTEILDAVDQKVSIHDFRMVDGKEQINLIFDMVVPYEYDDQKEEELRRTVEKLLHIADPRYQCVITVERSYIDGGKR